MELSVNGAKEIFEQAAVVSDVLDARGHNEKVVVVELNGVIVPRGDFAHTALKEGDELEIVHIVGGG
ncbi:MAG: sulfur carrier protein ThiS [Desulfovibrio sp.]|jgi:sulfur carrier protein|nr:sulfur carrier protein ThiS [Desulfovibrio sp.]